MKLNLPLFSALNSFIVAQFLFFIDEGYYNFRWMKDIGNWMVFVVYFFVLFGMLLLLNSLLEKIKVSRLYQTIINLIVFPGFLIFMRCI
ncbi:hypothetical protein FEDK69T_04900 [Flavobacterium enshiense DK69]|uniref:Uncharacterized protein n=1 Tax=Flavobacterium enshiense DK69 TaxID=1107311 RepID=V6SEN5_9FLAO|nr:hypothetical protein [Flavobacterium enshiense]ESU24934.1 hypothetical protein FEDK69T_04900 [Flavobacterium enshiense DK69]KGO96624.1 hypothetical protein Q767_02610 [Flavobacterium enshiense DK69]